MFPDSRTVIRTRRPEALIIGGYVRGLSDRDIEARACAVRAQATASIRAEMFALVREASRRVLGLWPFDEQVLAAIALDDGHVVEMQTGEGKTLAAVMPAALRALTGRGVHVLTVNDYLARRDAEWMGPIYRMLGLAADFVQQGMTPGWGVADRLLRRRPKRRANPFGT